MSDPGYATASPEDVGWAPVPVGPGRAPLTDRLGCTETTVVAYRFRPGDAVTLSSAPEQVCVCLPGATSGSLSLGAADLPPRGVGRVPAGAAPRLQAPEPALLFVVAAPADPAPSSRSPESGPESGPEPAPTTVDLDACEFAPPETSAIDTARLTAPLGCAGTKVNARRLDPGGAVPYHTEGTQEELFVPVSGSTAMRVAGERSRTPPGTVTRVAPPVPRSAVDAGEGSLWVMIGAPPAGGPTEWDPGAEIVE